MEKQIKKGEYTMRKKYRKLYYRVLSAFLALCMVMTFTGVGTMHVHAETGTDEISQILGISKRQAAKLVQRFSLPKISRSGRIYVDKNAFEELLARGKLT